jgi:hypothetical protein
MSVMTNRIEAMEPGVLERRRHERADLRLRVEFRVVDRDAALMGLGEMEKQNAAEAVSHEVFTDNISESGFKVSGEMQLLGGRPLETGSFLVMELEMPDTRQLIQAMGAVAWSRWVEKANRFEAGIALLATNHGDIESIARLVRESNQKS